MTSDRPLSGGGEGGRDRVREARRMRSFTTSKMKK